MTRRDLTRRSFLGGVVASALVPILVRPAWAGRGAGPGGAPLAVVVFLRGGADGLALVPPLGDRELARLRGALVPQGALAFGSNGDGVEFGLHPALEPLRRFAADRQLAAIHAVGLPRPVRSHFEAQDLCERAGAGPRDPAPGWLARALAASPEEPRAFRAVAAASRRPLALAGDPRALAFERPDALALRTSPAAERALHRLFDARANTGPPARLAAAGSEALEATAALAAHLEDPLPVAFPVPFPVGDLGERLATVARLARADLGLAAAWVDAEGWDTHVRQGAEDGLLARAAGELAAGLSALGNAVASRYDQLLVIVVTEFGRTVAANGSGGTDHGRAGVALALGGAVKRGGVLGRWPGLRPDALDEGRYLRVTTDVRDLFAEAARHLGARDLASVLPGYEPGGLGLRG